jgi:hypothetical protein
MESILIKITNTRSPKVKITNSYLGVQNMESILFKFFYVTNKLLTQTFFTILFKFLLIIISDYKFIIILL